MYSINLGVGPCTVHLDTDEQLSFDAIESLLNRGTLTVLTLMNAHMGAMVKYENFYAEADPMVDDYEDKEITNVIPINLNKNPEEI